MIRVENLSKHYRLGAHSSGEYQTVREVLTQSVSRIWNQFRRWRTARPHGVETPRGERGGFWALKDVSFEVQPGTVVGIIGRNGAGKSTLLKILSRITEPTSGRAEVRGRIGSLLEVGTGFHHELTGRENIYVNGSILGMRRREIERRFDAIVAFAGMEQFLDTPVKRYSSGMYVRLAFAVAAHLDPEILIVDEVLAVGDATYQRRCIERMTELARSGRTVLFVSHNMDLVQRMCNSAVLLERGEVVAQGAVDSIVQDYLGRQLGARDGTDLTDCQRVGDGRARFTRFWLEGPDGQRRANHQSGDDLTVCMEIDASQELPDVALAVVIKTVSGARLISSWTAEVDYHPALRRGRQVFRCRFRRVAIRPGQRLVVVLWMESAGVLDYLEDAGIFEVTDGPTTRSLSSDPHQGAVLYDYTWQQVPN
jgi:lipopolysaccharide transport system ATP-binding protein